MSHKAPNYNTWHQQHTQDDDISTPWHRFAQSNLKSNHLADKTILEIGCGRGGFSNYLANLLLAPRQIFACDYSASALEIARAKYDNKKITWQKEDVMNMSFDDECFDVVISCETIEHIENPAKAISEFHRVLKPGGKLILTCPNYFNLFGIWCFYRCMIGKPYMEGGQPYVNYITMPTIYWLLKNNGFKVEKFLSRDITIPARVPKHYYNDVNGTPKWLKIFGSRTFYVVSKR